MSFISEFKEFAMKGNVVDMAIGVIIGGAFGKIVASLVSDIIMPVLGVLVGGVDFKDLKWVIEPAKEGVEAVTLNYGMFIQNIFDFLIIALAIFIVLKKLLGAAMKKKEEPVEEAAPEPTAEEKLLTEIRDLLKK